MGIIILVLILSGIGWAEQPRNGLFHSYVHNTGDDPVTLLWKPTAPNNDFAEFNGYSGNDGGKATYKANCFSGLACIDLGSDSSITSIALTKITNDFSTVSGKMWTYNVYMATTSSTPTQDKRWGFYLTTNGTVPTHAIGSSNAYDPKGDPSVYLFANNACTSSCNIGGSTRIESDTGFLRTIGTTGTIASEDSGCGGSSSIYMCGNAVYNPSSVYEYNLILNFTGATNGGSCNGLGIGNSCSYESVTSSLLSSTSALPWFQFQSIQYYVGFYLMPGLGSEVYFAYDTGAGPGINEINSVVITPTGTTQPSNIDTGGFFGPIIKALISIGVFILQNIISFATFLYTLYIAALNIMGAWLGLGNVGFNLDSFLRAFVTFMGQMASIIANLGSGITVLINDVSIGGIFIVGLLTSTASWLSAAVSLSGKLKQIFDLVFQYGNNMLWIFFWSTFFLYTATGEGWSGTLEFFNAVNWASSLGANFVIRMVNFGVQAIAFLKGFIPTEAGAPPPTSPVSEGGSPTGASLQSTAKPQPVAFKRSRLQSGFSRSNLTRARSTVATKFKLSASRPSTPSFSAALEWDPIKVILLLGGLLLLMLWIGGGLSPFGAASATCTSTVQPTAGNTARCFETSYDILSQITAPILLMFASIGSITFLADKFGMIGSTFEGPVKFKLATGGSFGKAKQRRELRELRLREKALRMKLRR